MQHLTHQGRLILENGLVFEGTFFGNVAETSGEVVFNTGMVGYPEALTDPSYAGQILVFTYPLIGNYGVPKKEYQQQLLTTFESDKIQVRGIIVAEYCQEYSHGNAEKSLHAWLQEEHIPALHGIDTRALTTVLREQGTMLGKIMFDSLQHKPETAHSNYFNPNNQNIVASISIPEPKTYNPEGTPNIVVVDCGVKNSIIRSLVQRGASVTVVPWDHDLTQNSGDGILLSNGPGDPQQCTKTIENVRQAMHLNIPIFGICLGSQILGLAAGAKTYKLKYGHRSQNQPCTIAGTKRCFITSQNHGFAVDPVTLPEGWKEWFVNSNDGTNEGIIHTSKPFRAVQFHPEAHPGPTDTAFLFDEFIALMKSMANKPN